ncbi:hypothetical protein GCM10009592_28410 [Brachybacterium rhamnosum]|uniref:Uncharacterized protein n=1 Tax=Brachybacterium rhamnosum TaxID=173361 RepID=A0ABW4Q1X1_9MICO
MIPRQLPRLVTDALENRWAVDLRPLSVTLFAYFTSRSGHGDEVEIQWIEGRVAESYINGVPTPYAQCARLIRATP